MNNGLQYKKWFPLFRVVLPVLLLFLCLGLINHERTERRMGVVKLTFLLNVNGRPLVLNDTLYNNIFGEPYRLSKFKFYVGEPGLKNLKQAEKEKQGYHLVDATQPQSQRISFALKPGEYNELFFTLGIDSARNCSGAQTGALDPMNDMFWTWNSGYVMVKMEGVSAVSSSVNQRFEYHIGGYKGKNSAVRTIALKFASPLAILPGKTTEIPVVIEINNWWNKQYPLSIKDYPVCTTPGEMAGRISLNYKNMFSLRPGAVSK